MLKYKQYSDLFLTTTDTIVGIGAPISQKNKEIIYALKKRSSSKKLIIMIGSLEQARKLKGWNEKAESFAKKYWPGAVTLVVNENLALRIPNCKKLCNLLLKIGPVYMTSANISGKKSLSFNDAKMQFPEIKNHYDFGKGTGQASMIIDIETGRRLR